MRNKITLSRLWAVRYILLLIPGIVLSQNDNSLIDAAGDIAIVGYHDDDDGFSFVLLDDCPNGTSIRFVDDEWTGGSFSSATGEGEVLWTNNTGATIDAGVVIDITDADDNSTGITASTGVATEDDPGFSTAVGDQLFAITGTRSSPGTFLTFAGCPTGNTLSGTGLTVGTNAIEFCDEGYYTGTTTFSNTSNASSTINNVANWTLGAFSFPNDIPDLFTLAPTNTAPVATAPSAPTVNRKDTNVALADDIQIVDSDGDDQTVSFTITGGTLTLGTSGISFGGSGNGTAAFTATGTLANINAALDAATFTPNTAGINAGTISFTSNDGTDDSNTASVTFNIDYATYTYSSGAWSPNNPVGDATINDDIVVSDGTATISSDISINDITVASGAGLNISAVLTLGGDITNNGTFTFKSNASADGELATLSHTPTITGDITVERYFSNHRAYRMVSSAVTTSNSINANWQEGATTASGNTNPNPGYGTHITGGSGNTTLGFDDTQTDVPSMYTVDESTQEFTAVGNTSISTLNANDAYLLFVRGDRSIDLTNNTSSSATTLRASGTLATGNQTQNFTVYNGGDFVMFGNPYQATVDVREVFANASTDADVNASQFYVFDPTLAPGSGQGAYVTVDLISGTSPKDYEYLQPGQAAQAQVTALGSTDIVFEENDKATGNNVDVFRSSTPTYNSITGSLYTEANYKADKNMHDRFSLVVGSSFDNAVNFNDAQKVYNFGENMAIKTQDKMLAIERRASINDGDILQLFNNNYSTDKYTLTLNVNGLTDLSPKLNDAFTGEIIDLNAGENVFNFSVSEDPASSAEDRFSISFGNSLSLNEFEINSFKVYPNPMKGNAITIAAPQLQGKTAAITITNILGQTIYAQKHDFNSASLEITPSLTKGVYLLKIDSDGLHKTQKIIKE